MVCLEATPAGSYYYKMIGEFLFRQRKIILFLFIPLLSLSMHWHVFKTDLVGYHVWRQTQTQNTIESFYKEDFNILKPKISNRGNGPGIFRMEFPIMQWTFACFYKVFGDHLIITRILSFITGLFKCMGNLLVAFYHIQSVPPRIIRSLVLQFFACLLLLHAKPNPR